MANRTLEIQIDSILGGFAPTSHFSSSGQFRGSLGIDPAQPMDDTGSAYSTVASGLLRPVACESIGTLSAAPLWFVTNPKTANTYVYCANSSVYSIGDGFTTVTALSDAGELTNGLGNGAEYYDNYVYFAKNTTVARLGPLNGTLTLNGDYWVGTLTKTALTDTSYPQTFKNKLRLPNHILKRHSDGRLYILDVVGNQGNVHYIQTSKTTVEGDTNNGSTYGALTFGYGLYPTACESYGEELAIAFYEGSNDNLKQAKAKLAFWDTTQTNINKIIWVEFPDQIITALKNVNGILYTVSGNINAQGFRICRFVGGYQFQEVWYSETGEPCLPGAVEAILNRFIFGTHTNIPAEDGTVCSVGLQKDGLGNGVFGIMRATGGTSSTSVTAVAVADNYELGFNVPVIGWTQAGDGSTGVSHAINIQGTTYNGANQIFWSQLYRIGEAYKITKITITTAQAIGANMTIVPKLYLDDGSQTVTLQTIDNTNYSGLRRIVYKPTASGYTNFWLELKWTGSALCTVNLPIKIEYELIDD